MKLFSLLRLALAFSVVSLVGATVSVAGTPPAPAKQLATFRSTSWRVECENNGTALDCETTNRIVQSDGEQIAFITIHPTAEGDSATAVVRLPLGIILSAPVQFAVDGKSPVTLALNRCFSQGCIASAVLPASFVARARQGKDLVITFGAPNGQDLAMSIALKGFGLAYDRLSH